MNKIPLYRNVNFWKWSIRVAGLLCIIVGLILLVMSLKLFALGFGICGIVTLLLPDDEESKPSSNSKTEGA